MRHIRILINLFAIGSMSENCHQNLDLLIQDKIVFYSHKLSACHSSFLDNLLMLDLECSIIIEVCCWSMLLMSFKYAEVHRRPPAWKCNSEVVEAATGSFKLKKVYLKNSQNSLESTCARVSFLIKLTQVQVFSCEFCKILRTPFLQNMSGRLLLQFYKSRGIQESTIQTWFPPCFCGNSADYM